MLSVHGRKPAAVVVEPVAKLFLKMGLTPNVVTIVGTLVTIAIAVVCIPLDHLFAAAVLSGLFAAFDMLDGTMARMTTGGSKFGATLDASCDRITDGALFSAILYWLVYVDNARPIHVVACLIVLVSSQVISYIKAPWRGFWLQDGWRPDRAPRAPHHRPGRYWLGGLGRSRRHRDRPVDPCIRFHLYRHSAHGPGCPPGHEGPFHPRPLRINAYGPSSWIRP